MVDVPEVQATDDQVSQPNIPADTSDQVHAPTTVVPNTPLSIADPRAEKWDMALGADSPGHAFISQAIQNGDSENLQRLASAKADQLDTSQRIALINKIAALRQGPLSQEESDIIQGLHPGMAGRDINNNTVMEREYAHALVSSVASNELVKNSWAAWNAYHPDSFMDGLDVASNGKAKQEIVQRLYEDYNAKYEAQGLPSRFFQGAKQFVLPASVPGSTGFNVGGPFSQATPDVKTDSWFAATNRAQQWAGLYSKDPATMERTLRQAVEYIWSRNPADAVDFLQSGIYYPSSEQTASNVMQVAAGAMTGGTIASALMKGAVKKVVAEAPNTLEHMAEHSGAYRNPGTISSDAIMWANEHLGGLLTQKAEGVGFWAEPTKVMTLEDYVKAKYSAQLLSRVDPKAGNLTLGPGTMDSIGRNLELFLGYEHSLDRLSPYEVVLNDAARINGKVYARTPDRDPYEVAQAFIKKGYNVIGKMAEDGVVTNNRKFVSNEEADRLRETYHRDTQAIVQQVVDIKSLAVRASDTRPASSGELSAPAEGTVRFYHGGDNPGSGGGRWVSNDPKYAQDYRKGEGLHYVDIPETWLEQNKINKAFDDTGTSQKAGYVNFEAPEEFAKQMKPVPSAETVKSTFDSAIEPIQGALRNSEPRVAPDGKVAGTDPAKIMEGAGDLDRSARIAAAKDAQQLLTNPNGGPMSIQDTTLSIAKFLNPAERATGLSGDLRNRLMIKWGRDTSSLASALLDPPKIQRLSADALAKAFALTKASIEKDFNTASVLDMKYTYGIDRDNPSGVNWITAWLGKRDSTLFPDYDTAKTYANLQLKLDDTRYIVKKEGGGWKIGITRPVDETTGEVRALNLEGKNQPPVNIPNMVLRALRSSKDTTSVQNSEARELATHGSQAIQAQIKSAVKDMGKLSSKEYTQLSAFIQRDKLTIAADGKPGRYFSNVTDFEQEFFNQNKAQPTDKQIDAYFTIRRLNDFDYLARNYGFIRDMSRQGVEVWNVRTKAAETATDPSVAAHSGDFYGRAVDSLPSGKGFGVYVTDHEAGSNRYYRAGDAGLTPAYLKELTDKGYKIIQVAAPIERPLKDMPKVGTDYVNFVVTKGGTSKPMDAFPIPYREGGHIEYQNDHFVKQPVFSRSGGRMNFEGDSTMLSFASEKEAGIYTGKMEEMRRLYAGKDDPATLLALRDHLAKNLPWELKEVVKNFESGAWDKDAPFIQTTSGRSTLDTDRTLKDRFGALFHNEQDSPHNLMTVVDKKFLGERDPLLQTIKERGTETNPQFVMEDARVVDPFVSLNRTTSNIVNQRLVSDYKVLSAESWVQFVIKNNLVNTDSKALQAAPMYYLHHPDWITDNGVNSQLLGSAKANRLAVMNFLNMDTPDINAVKWFQGKALNFIYDKLGQGASDQVSEHLLGSLGNDPFRYARNIAFYSKMAFFNPVQFINQMQTLVHVMAVSGVSDGWHGLNGMTFGLATRFTDNPVTLRAVAEKFAKVSGWTADDMLQARAEGIRSGWFLVQGETSWRNDIADPSMFKTGITRKVQSFLDSGSVFFREGERNTREAAWYSAFKQWKDKNPGAEFTDNDLASVLNRADTLSLNMTRASSAPWEGGPIAGSKLMQIAGQFGTYQIRLFEQLWGSRLTQMEKARVVSSYAAMYGIPVAAGSAVGFWPMYDSMRTSALERGQNWDGSLAEAMMEGMPAFLFHMMTGQAPNIAERFGTQGLSQFSDLWKGDKAWYQVMSGVSGQTVGDFAQALNPVFHGIAAIVTGNSQDFPLLPTDAIQVFKPIAEFNALVRAYYGWNYGKFLSKNGVTIADVSKMEVINNLAFGLTTRQIADTFRETLSMKTVKEAQGKAEALIANEINQGLTALGDDDKKTFDAHMVRAQHYFAAADLPPQQWKRILKEAGRNVPTMDRINYNFNIRNVPDSQASDRREAFINGR